MKTKKIALFASGSGTNAQNIIEYFAGSTSIVVDSVWSNNSRAFALQRARNLNVDALTFTRDELYNTEIIVSKLKERKIDLIVLAGFLWLVPLNLIQNFKILNIHPALLPKYGGKGMYGMHVHNAVVANKEPESGITIHFVNEVYDDGKIVFQAKCKIESSDSPEQVAAKVHELEYQHFPKQIEKILLEMQG